MATPLARHAVFAQPHAGRCGTAPCQLARRLEQQRAKPAIAGAAASAAAHHAASRGEQRSHHRARCRSFGAGASGPCPTARHRANAARQPHHAGQRQRPRRQAQQRLAGAIASAASTTARHPVQTKLAGRSGRACAHHHDAKQQALASAHGRFPHPPAGPHGSGHKHHRQFGASRQHSGRTAALGTAR